MLMRAAMITASVFVAFDGAWKPLLAIWTGEPSIRISSAAFIAILGVLLSVTFFALVVARWLRADALAVKVEVPLAWLSIVTIISVPLFSIGGSLLQHGLLPRYGYHYCNLLSGNPTVWFNDWVKNPEWCVRGKTHEWVREQAAKAQNNSTD
jgi:hypothetical protein